MRTLIAAIVAGLFVVAAALFFLAITNKPSQELKFHIRHLLSYRPIDERSRLQLVLEAGVSAVLGCIILWLLLRG